MGRIITDEKSILLACKSRLSTWQLKQVVVHYDRMNSGKINVNGRWIQMSKSGTPDLIAYIALRDHVWVYFIECKTDIGRQSEEQIEFEIRFKKYKNVVYEIVRHPKQVDATIERITQFYQKQLNSLPQDIS